MDDSRTLAGVGRSTYGHLGLTMEFKTVDVAQRIIVGHAAIHGNVDKMRDVLDPQASVKAIGRLNAPSDVMVTIGHDTDALPVGTPLSIRATPTGIHTETYIYRGPVGDNLLAVAEDMLNHGQQLGMSIGYKTLAAKHDRVEGKTVRRLMDIELKEYCFASNLTIVNPRALAYQVKALSSGSDAGGGYLLADAPGGKWKITEGDDGTVIGVYDSRETADAVLKALNREVPEEGEEEDDADGGTATKDKGRKMSEQKTEWTGKYVDDLPDSAFMYIQDGGQKDSDGKTVPRSLRHVPVRDANGSVDLPHVRDAISRIPQLKGIDDQAKARLQARAKKMLEDAPEGKTSYDELEWKSGSAIDVRAFAYDLLDASEAIANEQKAMRLLGDDVKGGLRIKEASQRRLDDVVKGLTKLVDWSRTIDKEQDGVAKLAWLKRQLELTEV